MKKFKYYSTYKIHLNYSRTILNEIFFNYTYFLLLGKEGFFLFSFLLAEGENRLINNLFIPSARISQSLDLNQNQLIEAFSLIEKLNLINIYFDQKKNRYIYELKKPLECNEFFKNTYFTNLLLAKIGKENYDLNLKFLQKKIINIKVDSFELINDFKQEQENINLNDNLYSNQKEKDHYNFSVLYLLLKQKGIKYEAFFNFKLKKLLNEYENIYGLDNFEFARIISESYDFLNGFDLEKFKEIIVKNYQKRILNNYHNSFIEKERLKWNHLQIITPENFLLDLLNIDTLINSHQKLITILREKYFFSDYFINILLDYSYLVNNKQIVKNYILKIANSIKEENIKDPTYLINYLKQSFRLKNSNIAKTKEIKWNQLNLEDEINNISLDDKNLFKDVLYKNEK
ncbi:MAG: chromosome replication initiation/membrane attachment protein [Candidatus Hepatoplasma scabrum]|nr:MAG: chromosome replication initiation/membrane attachment protein [Candidatus Hepatoplasma sp.]